MIKTTHTKPSKLFRVHDFYTAGGKPLSNTDVDRHGRPAMYPFELMRPGEFFVVEAARNRLRAVVAAVTRHNERTGCQFRVQPCPENPKKITVTRVA